MRTSALVRRRTVVGFPMSLSTKAASCLMARSSRSAIMSQWATSSIALTTTRRGGGHLVGRKPSNPSRTKSPSSARSPQETTSSSSSITTQKKSGSSRLKASMKTQNNNHKASVPPDVIMTAEAGLVDDLDEGVEQRRSLREGGTPSGEGSILDSVEELHEEVPATSEMIELDEVGGSGAAWATGDGLDDLPTEQPTSTPAQAISVEGEEEDPLLVTKELAVRFPDLAAEYEAAGKHNIIPLAEVMIDSGAISIWRCPDCNDCWPCAAFIRCVLKNGCPRCQAVRQPCVALARPELVSWWSSKENDPLVDLNQLPANSPLSARWCCPSCHDVFTARVKDLVSGKVGCPSCALHHTRSVDALAEDSLLRQEFHPLKNGDLRLDDLTPATHKTLKVWWLCSQCGSDWEATIAARLSKNRRPKGRLCPACKGVQQPVLGL